MFQHKPQSALLTRHPDSPRGAVRQIEACVRWTEVGALSVVYTLTGDLRELEIPAPRPAQRTERLWQYTCFEAFMAINDTPEYYEFNFAPSGAWAVYAFRSYRERAARDTEELAPAIAVRSTIGRLELEALVRLNRLTLAEPGASLRLALAAVIEEKAGGLSYWALHHPPGKPDFHHRKSFTLEVAPAGAESMRRAGQNQQ